MYRVETQSPALLSSIRTIIIENNLHSVSAGIKDIRVQGKMLCL
jgi:hypothetical protein